MRTEALLPQRGRTLNPSTERELDTEATCSPSPPTQASGGGKPVEAGGGPREGLPGRRTSFGMRRGRGSQQQERT